MMRDLVYFTAIFFGIILISPIIYLFVSDFNDVVQVAPEMPTVAKTEMQQQTSRFNTVLDYAILLVFFGGLAGMIALAWALPTNSLTAFVLLIVIGLVGLLSAALSNAYMTVVAGGDAYATAAAGLPVSYFIAQYYLYLILFAGMTTFVVFFAKPNQEGVFG